MDEQKKPYFSYENSKRVIEQNFKIDRQIDLMADMMNKQRVQMIHEVNKAVYELAEKKEMSVYDICFHFVPVEKYVDTRFEGQDTLNPRYVVDMEVELTPVKFELEKGPGYWKSKYYRLKENLLTLINNKDD